MQQNGIKKIKFYFCTPKKPFKHSPYICKKFKFAKFKLESAKHFTSPFFVYHQFYFAHGKKLPMRLFKNIYIKVLEPNLS